MPHANRLRPSRKWPRRERLGVRALARSVEQLLEARAVGRT